MTRHYPVLVRTSRRGLERVLFDVHGAVDVVAPRRAAGFVAAALLVVLLAGCSGPSDYRAPAWCPTGEPVHMEGPVEIRVGFGQVWVSNATTVAKFDVPDEQQRQPCEGEFP